MVKDRNDPGWIPQYECDRCGACCQFFTVSCHEQDRQAQPALEAAHQRLKLDMVRDYGPGHDCTFDWHGEIRKDFAVNGCPFQCSDGACGIYESRPHVCRAFKAGSSECQNRRGMAGLSWLNPGNWYNKRTGELWHDVCS